MRTLWKDVLAALWMGMVLPGIVLNLTVMILEQWQPLEETVVQACAETRQTFPVLLRRGDQTEQMDMDAYLTGVVLAEMPASFREEALKAQAVAARTYTRKAAATGGKHGDGSICTDAACCQAYLTEEAYLSKGGTQENLEKVRAAVAATSGQVLTYDGELIEATYFSSSGGSTEAAAAVWGADFPYLQTVSSPEEALPVFSVSYTPLAFQKALGAILPGAPESWFGEVTYTEGGGVESLEIGQQCYSGAELRSLLGLRSTAFDIAIGEEMITITTKGYGHRVGMSQYGANAMAEAGNTCEEILTHYYPGTQLETITE